MSSPKPPSRLTNWRDYLPNRDIKAVLGARVRALRPSEHGMGGGDTLHNLSQWAGQKIRRSVPDAPTVNQVDLFPGWATRRPLISAQKEYQRAFDLHVHISGIATSRRTPEFLTRSQRTFLRLAKTFAALPKVQPIPINPSLDSDEIRGLRLPPRPYEITDDYDVEDLDRQFRGIVNETNMQISDSTQFCVRQPTGEMQVPASLQQLHENLESRLRPFWASALSSRTVQVSILLHPPCLDADQHAPSFQPIITSNFCTGSDGFFSGIVTIHWDDICTHPIGSRIAFDETYLEHELEVQAQVLEPDDSHVTSPPRTTRIPITQSTVRVISDIDDTVKLARVLDGARAVFHNIFVKDLEEAVIPAMAKWYRVLWGSGARFHYVSNSPYELLPVIQRFLDISGLPPGSIRLRSYTGKSLFNGILSAPATRKRANVIEVLDHFLESRFILVGDSGEQDMELYAQLAADRPDQIAGVFIRDVTAVGLDDPTGTKTEALSSLPMSLRKGSGGPELGMGASSHPVPKRAMTIGYPLSVSLPPQRPSRKIAFAPSSCPLLSTTFPPPSIETSCESLESSSSSTSLSADFTAPISFQPNRRSALPITEGEKKRWELQSRVYRARLMIPGHIPFRVFEDPMECVEAEVIVKRFVEIYPGQSQ